MAKDEVSLKRKVSLRKKRPDGSEIGVTASDSKPTSKSWLWWVAAAVVVVGAAFIFIKPSEKINGDNIAAVDNTDIQTDGEVVSDSDATDGQAENQAQEPVDDNQEAGECIFRAISVQSFR